MDHLQHLHRKSLLSSSKPVILMNHKSNLLTVQCNINNSILPWLLVIMLPGVLIFSPQVSSKCSGDEHETFLVRVLSYSALSVCERVCRKSDLNVVVISLSQDQGCYRLLWGSSSRKDEKTKDTSSGGIKF